MELINGNLIELVCDKCGRKTHSHKLFASENLKGWLRIEGNSFCLCPDCSSEKLQLNINADKVQELPS